MQIECEMRKVYLLVTVLAVFAGRVSTQEVAASEPTVVAADSLRAETAVAGDSLSVPLAAPIPVMDVVPFSMYGISPYGCGYMGWNLHKGFNASIGMNVTFSPDKYAPSGVGFGQNAAFMYAVPVTDRLSVAAGIYASNFNWGFINCRNVGFAGVAAFKVSDRISVYAYGNKSFVPKRPPRSCPMPDFAPDRLGGMVNFKLGESASVSFGVEGVRCRNGYYWW